MMVPRVGVEPTLPCGNRILSPARLPIPPSGRFRARNKAMDLAKSTGNSAGCVGCSDFRYARRTGSSSEPRWRSVAKSEPTVRGAEESREVAEKGLASALSVRCLCALSKVRAVAQTGSALAWGARGREFKSHRPDHLETMTVTVYVLRGVRTGRRYVGITNCLARRLEEHSRGSALSSKILGGGRASVDRGISRVCASTRS